MPLTEAELDVIQAWRMAHDRAVTERVEAVIECSRLRAEVERLEAEAEEGCPVHGHATHGLEAEELRRGIERLVAAGEDAPPATLQRLLDDVDCRDSLAHLEAVERLVAAEREACAVMLEQNGMGAAARLVRYRGEEDSLADAGSLTRMVDAIGCDVAPGEFIAEPDALRDLLSLAMSDEPPTVEVIASWTDDQKEEATRWASAVHLRAGDHEVEVPPEPTFLRARRVGGDEL